MQQAIHAGSIPQECFEKKNSHCNYAVLTKQFFCDSSRVCHYPVSLGESNFGNCYDRTAHPPTSIALRSLGIPVTAIRVLLTSMQGTQYFLRTGFGESSESFGGTPTNPNFGLGQGNGASPPSFLALSSLIVNGYRRQGHGANVTLAFVGHLFTLAAVMYVDDTDILHWPPSAYTDDNKLASYVQRATMGWGHLSQALGGILKAPKCSIYFLSFKTVQGQFRLKSLHNLPEPLAWILDGGRLLPAHITIPQPQGPDVLIVIHDVSTASKMLGVHFSPSGLSTTHINQMVQRGLDWIDCLCTRPLIQRNVWFSFYLQLYPAISWGLVTTILPSATIEKKVQALYFKSLPLMGINGNIKKEWQSLPTMYQGLGLPCFPLVALAKKISFLRENRGNTGVAQSNALSLAYDDFIMEVVLYGNPLSWDYINYGQLATQATWFSNLWQLCHIYLATVSINKSHRQITPIRKNNRSIMSYFYHIGFCGNQLVGLNTVWKYKHFINLSDISLSLSAPSQGYSTMEEEEAC